MGMAPCLNYITGNPSTPSSSCCSQLASIIQSQPQCLCLVLNGSGALLGITVNQTLAVALPGACSVQTPPVSQCNVDLQLQQLPQGAHQQILQMKLLKFQPHHQSRASLKEQGLKQSHQQIGGHLMEESWIHLSIL